MIYLDYAANTPCDTAVLDTYVQVEKNFPGNPNSSHPAGRAAREKMETVTAGAASRLGILPSEVIWTSGASEANNLAVKGTARTQRHAGKHIITTQLEHASVSGPVTFLQEQGWEVDLASVGTDGRIDLEDLEDLMRDETVLVAVSAVDSELGVIQPVKEIAEICGRFPNCRLHVDATQAIGKIPFSFEGIDTASLTAHKFYGPNGIGMLYKKTSQVLEPLIHGGTGASLYRSGTPTLGLAAAMDRALELAYDNYEERYLRVQELNRRFRSAFAAYPSVRINSPAGAVPHILNLSVAGVKGTRFRDALSEKNVCVSVKSACSTDGTPSKTVFAVSRDRKNALSSWRISLSHLTSDEEADRFLEIFDTCYKELAR